jgi:flagellar hook-basal body complex protein FliE
MDGIQPTLKAVTGPSVSKRDSQAKDSRFADTLKSFYQKVNSEINAADKKAQSFAAGQPMDIHEVVIATEKADLSLRFLLQIRNKLLEGYQEIMRMQF